MNNLDSENELFAQKSDEKLLKKEKKNFKFKQQLVSAWQPKPTLVCAIFFYFSIFVIFFILGILTYLDSNKIYE